MKNINYLYLTILLILGLTSCKKEQDLFEEKLLTGTEYIEVSSKSEVYSFEVLSNQTIHMEADVDWIQLDSLSYEKGKRKVGFKVVKNEDDERSGIIVVKVNDELTKQVLIIQESGKVPVFFVTVDGTGDGKSWSSPTNLNTAIDQSTTNSIIYLTEGVYKPSKTIRNGDASEEADKTFEISKNISLIGGFEKDARPGAKADARIYKTILDGKMSSGKEAFHTVTITTPFDAESKVYLEGLIITGGHATDRSTNTTINGIKYSRGQGGGMLIANAIVHLKNVEILANKASADKGTAGFGAGVYAFSGAKLLMEDVKINNNINSANNGGGIWINGASMIAFRSQFNNNSAKGTAGGIHGYPDASITLYNSEVLNNSNTSYGAGVYMRDNSDLIMINTLVSGNTSTSVNGGGGVMLYDASNAHIISSTITGNNVVGPGAGIYRRSKANNLTIYNSIITGNKQMSTSTDVDAYSDNVAVIPVIKNTVITNSVYGDAGTILSGQIFSPSTMLSPSYLPIGTNNPALIYGIEATQLLEIANMYNPILDKAIASDKNEESRTSKVMGFKVK